MRPKRTRVPPDQGPDGDLELPCREDDLFWLKGLRAGIFIGERLQPLGLLLDLLTELLPGCRRFVDPLDALQVARGTLQAVPHHRTDSLWRLSRRPLDLLDEGNLRRELRAIVSRVGQRAHEPHAVADLQRLHLELRRKVWVAQLCAHLLEHRLSQLTSGALVLHIIRNPRAKHLLKQELEEEAVLLGAGTRPVPDTGVQRIEVHGEVFAMQVEASTIAHEVGQLCIGRVVDAHLDRLQVLAQPAPHH
eukprot:8773275-Pyramimonas_sp.AAC.1